MSDAPTIVTGAPGWAGTNLVKALLRGIPGVPGLKQPPQRPIRCLVQKGRDATVLRSFSSGIEIVDGDLTDPGSLPRLFDGLPGAVVYHCAGVIHPRSRVHEFFDVNSKGTGNLLTAAVRGKASRFIFLSSNSPTGVSQSTDMVFDESSPYRPYLAYGISKQKAEVAVAEAGRSGTIETVIARAPWFYGPFQPERQTRFYKMIKTGRIPVAGAGNNLRSLVYVDNLCQGLLLCEQKTEARGRIYWLADEKPYTMNQIIDTAAEVMEDEFHLAVKRGRISLPSLAGDLAYAADRLIQGLGFYSQEIHVMGEMNKTIVCSIARAKQELGYLPGVGLREGTVRSLEWLMASGVSI
jgi:nucleoside-diphosphate-sugar epimerase